MLSLLVGIVVFFLAALTYLSIRSGYAIGALGGFGASDSGLIGFMLLASYAWMVLGPVAGLLAAFAGAVERSQSDRSQGERR